MARGLVYTAVTGNYDTPRPVRVEEEGVDYMMVTDGDGAKGWDIKRARSVREDPRTVARRMKVCMPVFVHRKYDWFLWVDGTMEIIGPVKKFVESALKDHDFAAWKHPWWQCSYTEVDKCLSMRKDDRDRLEKGRQLLQERKFPKGYGQLATWVLLRKNTAVVKVHAREWWDDMVRTTMRDQVTFMMNLWRVDEHIQWLPGTVDDAKWLKFHRGHKR